ncbi:MAG: hypothetical protein IPP78_04485 [Holophagaceae bacterium]|nr:hypothetical protein [Holophagaceae bacterium]
MIPSSGKDRKEGKDIVITGLGLVLPCGDGLEAARQSWISGEPCFAELPPNLGIGRGAFCGAFNPAGIIPPMQLRRLDRPSRFAWSAVHQALVDGRMDWKAGDAGDRMAMTVGTVTGGSEAGEVFMRPYFERGPEGASPMVFPNCVANAASGHVALAFGIKGPSITQVARENAAFTALDQAMRWLRRNVVDTVLVIGTDGIFPLQMELLRRTGRLAVRGNPIANAATGYLPGEGAQAFLLETRSHAESRGAHIRGEVLSAVCASPTRKPPRPAQIRWPWLFRRPWAPRCRPSGRPPGSEAVMAPNGWTNWNWASRSFIQTGRSPGFQNSSGANSVARGASSWRLPY